MLSSDVKDKVLKERLSFIALNPGRILATQLIILYIILDFGNIFPFISFSLSLKLVFFRI